METRRALKLVAITLAVLALVAGARLGWFLYRHGMLTPATFDTVPPRIPDATQPVRLLLFSKTNGFRHVETIPVVNQTLARLARERGWGTFATENAAVHNVTDLAGFDIVVWNNVSGDVLTDRQKAAFRAWLEGGGRWLGLHGSGGDLSYAWRWYVEEVLRAQFIGHPLLHWFQEAELYAEPVSHPLLDGLPDRFRLTDEWYSFSDSPRPRTQVLLSIDERSYKVPTALVMGDDHPMAWTHRVGRGTVVYSAIGHRPEVYENPTYRRFLANALDWLMTQ